MFGHFFKIVNVYKLENVHVNIRNYVSVLNRTQILKSRNVLNINKLSIHISIASRAKLFQDHENNFAFKIINKNPSETKNAISVKSPKHEVTSLDTFTDVLSQDWRKSSCTEIVSTFKSVKNYCIQNKINVSDNRFDKLVDGLMDHCEKISDTELFELLQCLSELPPCDSATSHNFHDVWSCLDDVCCWKMSDWDIEQMFKFANIWYNLNLGKLTDYTFVLIDRLTKRADKLTKDQLVNIFFYFNVCRRRAVDFQYEFVLEKQIGNMNINEIAVVAMGYFKTKTKIKLIPIIEVMLQKVKEDSKQIHEISLTAIIKAIRLSKPLKVAPQIQSMLDALYIEMDRLSNLCCLHIALLGTGIQLPHNKTLQKTSVKLVTDMTNLEKVRLKDVERLLNVLSMFNYDPKTEPDIFKASYEELHKKERLPEFVQYPRCLACALNYLSMMNIYSYELMNKALDIEYINDTYGKGAKYLPRELLSLDASIDVECPDYKGNRLPLQLRHKATKWVSEYIPSYDQHKKITAGDQLFLDALDAVKDIVKDDSLIKIVHTIPQFSRADIILCRDKNSGKFVEPCGFENYILGDVMFPYQDDSLDWFAIVILGWNNTIRDTSLPLGSMIMKKRQLEKMGYNTNFVVWNEFLRLSREDKVKYILNYFSQ